MRIFLKNCKKSAHRRRLRPRIPFCLRRLGALLPDPYVVTPAY